MISPRLGIWPVLIVLAASPLAAQGDGKPASGDVVKRRAALAREAELANLKLDRARADVADQEAENAAALKKAETEIAFAEAKLAAFDEAEAPQRLKRARLELQGAEDALADAKEELAQLNFMYKDVGGDDMTKNLVIERATRGVKRAEERLAAQRAEVETVEKRTLPQERKRLAFELDERRRDAERTRRAGEKASFDKRVALKAAEHDVARIADDAADLEKPK
jgi:hypothetical protein